MNVRLRQQAENNNERGEGALLSSRCRDKSGNTAPLGSRVRSRGVHACSSGASFGCSEPLAPRGRGLTLDCRVVRISRGPRGRRRISRYANCRAELCSIARVIRRGRTRREGARLTRFCGRPVHRTTTRLHETGRSGIARQDRP